MQVFQHPVLLCAEPFPVLFYFQPDSYNNSGPAVQKKRMWKLINAFWQQMRKGYWIGMDSWNFKEHKFPRKI
jgi:hypothetical protein